MSLQQAWRDSALQVRLNHLHDFLRTLALGSYDDCDPRLLQELEECAHDLVTVVQVARKVIQS